MEILAWVQTFLEVTNYYCEGCALHALFNGREDMLDRVKNGDDTSFIDDDGVAFNIIHEDTFQYEQCAGEIIPLEGISCSNCGSELCPPLEGAA